MRKLQLVRALVIAGALLVLSSSRATEIFSVTLDTSPMAGSTAQLVFGFVDGDGVINNTVQLTAFNLGGGSIAGAADYLGSSGASGDVNSGISVDDSGGLALFAQALTLGSSLSFLLTTTDNFFAGGLAPDEFSMGLYSFDLSACYSDDQATCALLQLDLTSDTLTPVSFVLNGASDQGVSPPVVAAGMTSVPEPATLLLLTTGLFGLMPFWSRSLRS